MVNKSKEVLAIIQARYSSKRLPGKVLKKVHSKTILEILVLRLLRSKKISKIIVACTNKKEDKEIINICKKIGIEYYLGSENDVLSRYYYAAKKFKYKNIVRITSDCPLIDPEIVDKVIKLYFSKKSDYASNTFLNTYPDGLDVEIFRYKNLEKAHLNAKSSYEREHVTPHIIKNAKNINNLQNNINYSWMRLTLDDRNDLRVIQKIFEKFNYNYNFLFKDIIKLYKSNKEIFKLNQMNKRNEGIEMSTGQKVWKRASNIIPGGSMLFSKNPDLFLPGKWPAYFSRSKGCKIWDLDNKVYYDLCFMGVGTNTLGYCNSKVEKAVIKTIKNGNMTTLNSIDEVELAEKLVDMHSWSDMARFTRSGGEANSVAIRIARAASGKDNIAICGYHGWHDWYLSSNLSNNKKLDNHLMSNTPFSGVPKNLKNTCFPFDYNNFDQLRQIVEKKNIGVIKMEVERNIAPKNNFLKKVRKLATDKKIVLIFDECTSGFRQTFGGLHKFYEVNPDIAIFGKALGNGHAINAIIGKQNIMEHAKSTFISSTFWTERSGPTAALATLGEMEKIKSWKIISYIGKKIKKNWEQIARQNKIKIQIQGINALPNFFFKSTNNLNYKTLISQEMLKKRFLASNSIYCSIVHKEKILNNYFDILNDVFYKIYQIESGKEDLAKFKKTKTCISGIRNISVRK